MQSLCIPFLSNFIFPFHCSICDFSQQLSFRQLHKFPPAFDMKPMKRLPSKPCERRDFQLCDGAVDSLEVPFAEGTETLVRPLSLQQPISRPDHVLQQ